MEELPQVIVFALIVAGIVLAVAALIMPIVVILIDSRLAKVHKTLMAVEILLRAKR